MVVAYFALRTAALSGVTPPTVSLTLAQRVPVALAALSHYAEMVLWPFTAALPIGDPTNVGPARVLTGLLTLGGAAVLCLRGRHALLEASPQGELRRAGLTLCAVGLGLVLHLIPISAPVLAADRFLYLPLVGLALLAAPSLDRAFGRSHARHTQRLISASALLTLSALLITGARRVADWTSEVRLFTRAYHQAPRHVPLPGTELGNVYFRAGLYEHASAVYAATAEGRSTPILASNVLNTLGQRGGYQAASAGLNALCAATTHPKVCLDASVAALRLHQLPLARAHLTRALTLAPGYAPALALETTLQEVESLTGSQAFHSQAPATRLAAHTRLAILSGRRLEALELASSLLRTPGVEASARQSALEYLIRFGPPERLVALLQAAQVGPLPPELEAAAALRISVAEELLTAWPAVGLALPGPLPPEPRGPGATPPEPRSPSAP